MIFFLILSLTLVAYCSAMEQQAQALIMDETTVVCELGKATLHNALLEGQLESVEKLLMSGADVHAVDSVGKTPLHCAASLGHYDIVELLISKGAPVNAIDKYKRTPLHFAVLNDHEKVARVLIEQGALVRVFDLDGWSPLHLAGWNKNLILERLLVFQGANKGRKSEIGRYASILRTEAEKAGFKELLQRCIDKDVNEDGDTFLTVAAPKVGNNLKIEYRYDESTFDMQGNTLLHMAVANGHKLVVKVLLGLKTKPSPLNAFGATLLDMAVGADLVSPGSKEILLHMANTPTFGEIIKLLIDNGADLNDLRCQNKASPLHRAIQNDQKNAVVILVSNGADIRARDSDNNTPLHMAAMRSDRDVIALLISKGADLGALNEKALTPLHYAMKNEDSEVRKLVISNALLLPMLNWDAYKRSETALRQRAISFINTAISYSRSWLWGHKPLVLEGDNPSLRIRTICVCLKRLGLTRDIRYLIVSKYPEVLFFAMLPMIKERIVGNSLEDYARKIPANMRSFLWENLYKSTIKQLKMIIADVRDNERSDPASIDLLDFNGFAAVIFETIGRRLGYWQEIAIREQLNEKLVFDK